MKTISLIENSFDFPALQDFGGIVNKKQLHPVSVLMDSDAASVTQRFHVYSQKGISGTGIFPS